MLELSPKKDVTGTSSESAAPKWWAKHQSPVTEWKILNGNTFTNFFDFSKESLKANTMGWLRVKLHNSRKKGENTYLCLKYQCVGGCSSTCRMTHIDPDKLNEVTRNGKGQTQRSGILEGDKGKVRDEREKAST